MLNRALAEQLWPGEPPLGRTLQLADHRDGDAEPEVRVVGVVANTVQYDVRQAEEPVLYLPREQRYRHVLPYVLRTRGPADPAVEGLRRAVEELGPDCRLTDVETFYDYRWASAVRERLLAAGVALLGGTALFLALLGVFGAMSQAVSREARAIGVRIAVGARRPDVVWWIVGRGVRLSMIGAAMGGVGSLAAARLLQGALFGLGSGQLLAVGCGVLFLVLGTVALSAYVPSRRAAALDPSELLRSDA